MTKSKTECRWCGASGQHVLDGEAYCCKCFDQLVDHCGNIRITAPARINIPLAPAILKRILDNAAAQRAETRAALTVKRRKNDR